MKNNFILSNYIESVMRYSHFDKLEDGTFVGRINKCKGVIAFGKTLNDCENELQSVLEDWILVGLKMNHPLPVIDGIDLNKIPKYEQVDSL